MNYIFERLDAIKDKYPIVVCTSIEDTDNPIVAFCKKNGINYFRGSLDNVASRFLNCATENNYQNAVRINGDNLFLDSKIIEDMINVIEKNDVKFVSNVKNRTFPKGMSVEIVDVDFYRKQISNFSDEDLEHVMTYFYSLDEKHTHYVYNESKYPEKINLAIDTPEDFDNARKIIKIMKKDHTAYDYKDIIKLFYKLINNEKQLER